MWDFDFSFSSIFSAPAVSSGVGRFIGFSSTTDPNLDSGSGWSAARLSSTPGVTVVGFRSISRVSGEGFGSTPSWI